MLKCILSCVCIIIDFCVYAQAGITSNGNYVFIIEDKSKSGSGSTLVVKSTVTSWKIDVKGAYNAQFTNDGHYLICRYADSVIILVLGSSVQNCIPNSVSYKVTNEKKNTWLAVMQKQNMLLVKNLQTGNENKIEAVSDYWFNNNGSLIYVMQKEMVSELHSLDLNLKADRILWSGRESKIENLIANKSGTNLAFTSSSDDKSSSLWCYNAASGKVVSVTDLLPDAIVKQLSISTDPIIATFNGENPFQFTESGKQLLFYMQERIIPKIPNNYVDVWSYTDGKNQDAQLRDAGIARKYAFCLNPELSKVVRLEEENEKVAARYAGGYVDQFQLNGNHAIIYCFPEDIFTYEDNGVINEGYSLTQYNWNRKTNCDVYLLSLKDGKRELIGSAVIPASGKFPHYRLSPTGKYLLIEEGDKYFVYQIGSELIRNIGGAIPEALVLRSFVFPGQLLKWVNDTSIIIKDSYSDLWQVSLVHNTPPICVTNGFFKKAANDTDKIILKLNPILTLQNKNGYSGFICQVSCANRYFNDGLLSINLNNISDPKPIIEINTLYQYDYIKKAQNKNVYLVRRQNAQEPPKYFYTSDFKQFHLVTSEDPEERGQGVKTEVVTWKTFDGRTLQGVLYKPHDFDSSKKYPIIFSYYESKSQAHNMYRPYGQGDFVDYGYLVFSPDIFYTLGQTGQSAFNSIVSAAEFLSKRRYVDKNKMGIRGASFGGYETNYLVTHTKLFAAAISSSGYTDFISNFGALDNGRRPHQLEGNDQNRLGVTLWQRPDIWIKNSPIFYSDRVSTPLLLIHSQSDNNVPFEQNVAFFKALRSLGKRVWLLQYDQAGHIGVTTSIVGKPGSKCDMCTRQLQFFNHYLKSEPAPKWMLDGIPARLKGIEKRLELDSTVRTPGRGLIREKLALMPQQEELLKHRTMVTENGRIIDVNERVK